jgi:hypothetical protein
MHKRYATWVTILAIALLFVILFVYNPSIAFETKTKIIIHPSQEWELIRSIDGNLISVQKDHVNNFTKNYSVTEFQRGDAVQFVLNPAIFEKSLIKAGDTIGYIYSNEEQLRLIQLRGQIGILYSELAFHTTGQKPEDVDLAQKNVDLAIQEFETQKKLTARSKELVIDNVISKEQFDIDMNELAVKEIQVALAKASLSSIATGEKPEMEKLIKSKIEAINWEIDQIQNRLKLLTIVSPISGQVLIDHSSMMPTTIETNTETIVKIVDNSNPIGLMPIRLKHCSAIEKGAKVTFSKFNHEGKVLFSNNAAQTSLSAPYVYYVVKLSASEHFNYGEIHDVVAHGNQVPLVSYLEFHLTR